MATKDHVRGGGPHAVARARRVGPARRRDSDRAAAAQVTSGQVAGGRRAAGSAVTCRISCWPAPDRTVRVVNVKPTARPAHPAIEEALAWPGELFEARGWGYEAWSGADPVLLPNVRFLAGYRRLGMPPDAVTAAVLGEVRPRRARGRAAGGGDAAGPRRPAVAGQRAGRAACPALRRGGRPAVSAGHLLADPSTRLLDAPGDPVEGAGAELGVLGEAELAWLREHVAHVQRVRTGFRRGCATVSAHAAGVAMGVHVMRLARTSASAEMHEGLARSSGRGLAAVIVRGPGLDLDGAVRQLGFAALSWFRGRTRLVSRPLRDTRRSLVLRWPADTPCPGHGRRVIR